MVFLRLKWISRWPLICVILLLSISVSSPAEEIFSLINDESGKVSGDDPLFMDNYSVLTLTESDNLSLTDNMTVNMTGNMTDGNVSAEWVVGITGSPKEGYPPLCVKFNADGPDGDYVWDFGDGSGSYSRSPVHCYTKTGQYWVKLKYNYGDITGEVSEPGFVNVLDTAVFVDFEADPPAGKAPLSTKFSIIGDPTNILWDFGDGSPTISDREPVHQYKYPGSYTPVLTYCIDGRCTKKDKFNYIEVNEGDSVDFIAEKTKGNVPICTRFKVIGEVDSCKWDFGDGKTSFDLMPSHCYNDPGSYTITLVYSLKGAQYTITKENLIVVTSKDIPDFSTSVQSGTAPLCVDFASINPQNEMRWVFGDKGTDMGDHSSHCYAEPGVYDVSLEYCSNDLCDVTKKPQFIEVIKPMILATPGKKEGEYSFTTDGVGQKYLWNFGDGMTGEGSNPIHTYAKSGEHKVTLSISGQCGCTAITEITLNPEIPTDPDFTATPLEGCTPHCVQFNEFSPVEPESRLWEFGDGKTDTDKNPFHCYESPGKYTVVLKQRFTEDENEIVKPDYITANAVPRPSFTIYPSEGVAPLTVKITDTTFDNAVKRYWDFGDKTTGSEKTLSHLYTAPGDYNITLTVWGEGNCREVISKVLHVSEAGESSVFDLSGLPARGFAPLSTSFKVTGNPYQWNVKFGDGESSSDINPFHSYKAGIYSPSLHACNSEGCKDIEKPNYIVSIPAGTETLHLNSGWNLMSVPLTLMPGSDRASIFAGIDTAGHSLFSWNGEDGSWIRLKADDIITPYMGIWIYSNYNVDFPLSFDTTPVSGNDDIMLSRGWNLIGVPGISDIPGREALSPFTGWEYIVGFDGSRQQYIGPYDSSTVDNVMVSPALGWWIYLKDPLVVPSSGL